MLETNSVFHSKVETEIADNPMPISRKSKMDFTPATKAQVIDPLGTYFINRFIVIGAEV